MARTCSSRHERKDSDSFLRQAEADNIHGLEPEGLVHQVTKFGESIERYVVDELLGGKRPPDLDSDTRLVEEEYLDSLGIFEMVAWIEESHSVDIDPEEITIANFKTIGHIDQFIASKVSPS